MRPLKPLAPFAFIKIPCYMYEVHTEDQPNLANHLNKVMPN